MSSGPTSGAVRGQSCLATARAAAGVAASHYRFTCVATDFTFRQTHRPDPTQSYNELTETTLTASSPTSCHTTSAQRSLDDTVSVVILITHRPAWFSTVFVAPRIWSASSCGCSLTWTRIARRAMIEVNPRPGRDSAVEGSHRSPAVRWGCLRCRQLLAPLSPRSDWQL